MQLTQQCLLPRCPDHGSAPAQDRLTTRIRWARACALGLLVTGGTFLAGVCCAANARSKPGTLEAVLHGMEARRQAILSSVKTLSGTWEAKLSRPASPKELTGSPKDYGPGKQPWPRIEERSRSELAFHGDKYRELDEARNSQGKQRKRLFIHNGNSGSWCTWVPEESRWRCQKAFAGSKWERMPMQYLGLMSLPAEPETEQLRLGAKETRLAGMEKVDGHLCYVLEQPPAERDEEKRSLRAWVCPDYGYALVKWESRAESLPDDKETTNRVQRQRRTYGGFRPVTNGLWLPTTYSSVLDGQKADGTWVTRMSITAKATKLEVNKPVSAKLFSRPK